MSGDQGGLLNGAHDDVDAAVLLVLGVARLGETDIAGWWSSHGLDRAGRFVLGRAFRRTWRSVALELDIEAAARRHKDATAGRRTALHLFSDELPFRRWAISWLAEQKTAVPPSQVFDKLAAWDLATARAMILERTGDPPKAEVVGEGLRLGAVMKVEIEDSATLTSVARLLTATYLTIDGPFRVPYFDLQG